MTARVALTGQEMLALDETVCRALQKRPGESIVNAARRVLATPHGNPAWRVAHAILARPVDSDPWAAMRKAAKAARRIHPTAARNEMERKAMIARVVRICRVCNAKQGDRDPSIGSTCHVCGKHGFVHQKCQAERCESCPHQEPRGEVSP